MTAKNTPRCAEAVTICDFKGKLLRIDGSGAVLSGKGISLDDEAGAITINNSQNVVIKGLTLRDFRTKSPDKAIFGIVVRGQSSKIAIIDNTITDIGVDWRHVESGACLDDFNAGAIKIASSSSLGGVRDVLVQGNHITRITLGASEAVALAGDVEEFALIGNWIWDIDNIGIDIIGGEDYGAAQAHNGLVCGNTIAGLLPGNPSYVKDLGKARACFDALGTGRSTIDSVCWSHAGGIEGSMSTAAGAYASATTG